MNPGTIIAAAAAVKAVGSIMSGYNQAAQYEAQAGAAGYNAKVAGQNADTVSAQANLREDQMRRTARQTLGAQQAAIAESGTGLEGSNLDISIQDARLASLDALNARYAGQLERTGYLNERNAQLYASKAADKAAGRAKLMGWISAASDIMSSAGSYMGGMPSPGANSAGATQAGASAASSGGSAAASSGSSVLGLL